MSYITDVVLFIPFLKNETKAALEEGYRDRNDNLVNFRLIEETGPEPLFTGSKVFCSHLFGGAFNYLDAEECKTWLTTVIGPHEAIVIFDYEDFQIEVIHMNQRGDDGWRL